MLSKKRKVDEASKIKMEGSESQDSQATPTTGASTVNASPVYAQTTPPSVVGISRSISACQRCRTKKIKCDQRFPKCSKCDKSGAECIGLDPITGREIPRSYVVHLEERVSFLESQLNSHGIEVRDSEAEIPPVDGGNNNSNIAFSTGSTSTVAGSNANPDANANPNANNPNSNIAFSRLMTTAVKVNKRSNSQDKSAEDTSTPANGDLPPADVQLPAILPPKYTALYFLQIFFAQSNSQVPVVHREEFLKNYFIPVYGSFDYDEVTLASNLTPINKAFIEENTEPIPPWFDQYKDMLQEALEKGTHNGDIKKISNDIIPPKQYHKCLYFLHMVFAVASSVNHLQYPTTISESFRLAAVKCSDDIYNCPDPLESLQAVILHAIYSTMRSTTPAVWYILGIALRMCVDLDLHNEENSSTTNNLDFFTIDKRRRLFWCAYSIDRQICFYLDRPVGIPDESINTPFPSPLDDAQLTIGNDASSKILSGPSYKTISLAMFGIRKIQSEIQKVLYTNYEVPRAYKDLKEWKSTNLAKLNSWIKNIPTITSQMNCDFNLVFFYINYNHTNLMLHNLAPKNYKLSIFDFEQVHLSSKELIRCYTQLLRTKSINYTWAAVHNLFSAGTSYLYTIYNSVEVHEATSLGEVKQVTSECLNILESLIDRFEPALNYYEVFQSLTMAIIKLKYNKIVKGYSSLKVTAESLRKISNTNVNSNVSKLVEHMYSDQDTNTEPEGTDLLDPLQSRSPNSYKLKFKSQGMAQQDILSVDPKMPVPPPAFEWLSANYDSGSKIPPGDSNKSAEVDNLSKDTNKANRNNSKVDPLEDTTTPPPPLEYDFIPQSQYDFDTFFQELENLSPTSTHVSFKATEDGTQFVPSGSHEGRRTFELIHQMPNEVIWDQFFTRASTSSFDLSRPSNDSA